MDSGFELFDHTADLGVRAFAPSLPELVRVAGEGLYAAIGELHPGGELREEHFAFSDGDLAMLLRDYLAELLFIFERDHRMVTAIRVEAFEPGRLEVTGESHIIDPSASLFDREVKAVTYHGLELKPVAGGYQLEYIVDI